MKNLVIFASGSGTNAQNLIRHFKHHPLARVAAVFCNNPDAGVIEKAGHENVPVFLFDRKTMHEGELLDKELDKYHTDYIILSGFLWLFPSRLVQKYPGKIVNIHPALLPKFGGKGMYGDHVHRAVLAAGETEHGVTVHLVNEHYDEGKILLQEKFEVHPGDSLETISSKIHQIEYRIFPLAIEKLLND